MTNKVVLITGASSGMGKDFAQALLAEGFIVYVAARRLEKMQDLKALGAIPLKMDITQDQQITAAVDVIKKQHGGVDILINNAGFGLYGAMEDITLKEARYQFEVNLFGLARLTQLVLPYMRQQRAGKIINISSVGGKIYTPLGSWYHATKHALEGWSDCLRLELSTFNIDVVIIEPGGIQTEFADVLRQSMLKRSGTSAYAALTQKFTQILEKTEQQGHLSKPPAITRLVLKAVRSNKPKTRYSAGSYAPVLLFMRRYLSDRFFDKMVLSVFKR